MPSNNIQRLSQHTISSENKYFLDANIWITYLSNPQSPKRKEKVYMSFFESLISAGIPIYSHSLIISEVVNAMLRIAFKAYKDNLHLDPANTLSRRQIQQLNFKRDYRGTNDYLHHFRQITSDIEAYSPFVQLLDTSFEPDLGHLIAKIPTHSDFNDYFYHAMALDQSLTIVTDDGDFSYPGIGILTENGNLV